MNLNPTSTPLAFSDICVFVFLLISSMNLAISKAKSGSGLGWVCAKGSNHFGICQWYTEMALKEGLIGMASTNTSPLVTPTRAKTSTFGTNPISVRTQAFAGHFLKSCIQFSFVTYQSKQFCIVLSLKSKIK